MADSWYTTWTEKRDELRRRLAARRPRLDQRGPLRLARGAVVVPESLRTQIAARSAFLRLAGDVHPPLLVDLAGASLEAYDALWAALGGSSEADLAGSPDEHDRTLRVCQELSLDDAGAIWAWCRRWHLPVDTEVPPWTMTTEETELLRYACGHMWGQVVATFTVSRWRTEPLLSSPLYLIEPFTQLSDIDIGELPLAFDHTVYLPDLRWDPQREQRSEATKRILRAVRTALQPELDRIAEEAREQAVDAPRKRTGLEHLVWLARYQFRGESMREIARSVGKRRQSVDEAVRSAAELIGLPVRERNAPGRPFNPPEPPRIVRAARRHS